MPVPYLAAPPEVIPIDVGRQLLVNDFLIAETNLARIHHQACYYSGNPILSPDQPWETNPAGPAAMTFSDGVWYDPSDRLFKLWYMAGYWGGTAYAFSEDGIRWTKPKLEVKPGTNIVLDEPRGSTTVWLDQEDTERLRRFKLFRQRPTNPPTFDIYFSPDGIHWTRQEPVGGPGKDRSTLFRNPFRKVWVYSLILGLFSIWRGQPAGRPKPNEVLAGYSRDGFHWHRPNRRALAPVSERQGDWNWGNVQSTGGCVLVVGDELCCYVSGRAGGTAGKDSGVCTMGLAKLRRDGFAALRAGELEGTPTTRTVRISSRRLQLRAVVEGQHQVRDGVAGGG
ncbi:MAG: hypothetical protein NTY38_26720 [Acidobacteria bacterium]|nr:hypothetical protein [Acidobacteriota bacterium]